MRRTLALALVLALTAACAGLLVRSEDPRLEAWKAQASELRGLEFESSVRLEWVPASAFPEVIRAELDSTYTPESARRYRDAYAALGVFPPDIDLVETMIALQSQAIAGMLFFLKVSQAATNSFQVVGTFTLCLAKSSLL